MNPSRTVQGSCTDLVHALRINRRRFLQLGHLGLWTGGLLNLLAGRAGAKPAISKGKAKACIILFQVGGPYQCETYDPKPLAPEEIRGIFKPTRTPVVGLHMTEGLLQVARHADKL